MSISWEKSYQYILCGKCLISWNNIQRHMKNHAGSNPYSCILCGEEFISMNHFKRHIETHTFTNQWQCDLCGNVLISWNHLNSDALANSYPCDQCYKELFSKNYPKRRTKTRTGDIWYQCSVCCKGFISRNHLKRHMKSLAMDNLYQCILCVKEISINHQKRHINSHTGKFQIIVLFFLHSRTWSAIEHYSLVLLLPETFSFVKVICRQKKSMEIPCYKKCATHKCLLLVQTGNKLIG